MADGAQPPVARRPLRWRLVAAGGVLLLVAGLGILGWVCWQYFGTNIISQHRQGEMRTELHRQWDDGADPLAGGETFADGDVFALLRVPRFGDDYEMPLIKGVDDASLSAGIGWFPDTQRPGQLGNFALAAHRVTHGQPFEDFPDLREGDQVYVETRTRIYTYTLDDNGTDHAVSFTESWILDPVPGHPSATPTRALITLTTCSEIFHTDDRSYVFGHLTHTERKPVR